MARRWLRVSDAVRQNLPGHKTIAAGVHEFEKTFDAPTDRPQTGFEKPAAVHTEEQTRASRAG